MLRHACTVVISLGLLLFASGQLPVGQPSGFIVIPNQQQQVKSVTGIPPTTPSPPPVSFSYWQGNATPGVQEQTLINLINSHRSTIGVKGLIWHAGLGKAASDHNIAMNGALSFVANYPASLGGAGVWDILGRLQQAKPQIKFDDLAIILGAQQQFSVTSDASVFFTGGLIVNKSSRFIIERRRFTTIGCNLSTANNTWVIILGEKVTP